MTSKPEHRESLIAMRATRQALNIARNVAYPPIDAGPEIVPSEWVREQEDMQNLQVAQYSPPIIVRIERPPLAEQAVAPWWLVIFSLSCIAFVVLLAIFARSIFG